MINYLIFHAFFHHYFFFSNSLQLKSLLDNEMTEQAFPILIFYNWQSLEFFFYVHMYANIHTVQFVKSYFWLRIILLSSIYPFMLKLQKQNLNTFSDSIVY